jgi:hypothetical protein
MEQPYASDEALSAEGYFVRERGIIYFVLQLIDLYMLCNLDSVNYL